MGRFQSFEAGRVRKSRNTGVKGMLEFIWLEACSSKRLVS